MNWFLVWCSDLSRLKSYFLHTQHLLYPPKRVMTWNSSKSESIDLPENPFWRLINPYSWRKFPTAFKPHTIHLIHIALSLNWNTYLKAKVFCFLQALFFPQHFFLFAFFGCYFSFFIFSYILEHKAESQVNDLKQSNCHLFGRCLSICRRRKKQKVAVWWVLKIISFYPKGKYPMIWEFEIPKVYMNAKYFFVPIRMDSWGLTIK